MNIVDNIKRMQIVSLYFGFFIKLYTLFKLHSFYFKFYFFFVIFFLSKYYKKELFLFLMKRRRKIIKRKVFKKIQTTIDLFSAIKTGNVDYCHTLFDMSLECDEMEKNNANKIEEKSSFSPLLLAVKYNHPIIVRLLLSNGANVLYQDKLGNSAIHYVEQFDILMLLIRNGANRYLLNKDDHIAADCVRDHLIGRYLHDEKTISIFECVYTLNKTSLKEYFFDKGWLATTTNNNGCSLLNIFLKMQLKNPVKMGEVERSFVLFLLEYGAIKKDLC